MKKCTKCGLEKEISDFSVDRKTKDSLSFWCKQCAKVKQQKYYYGNKEKVIAYQKEYGLKNRDKLSSYMKEYRNKNLDRLKEYDRQRIADLKKDVLGHYGGKCACCGEENIAFLSLDHIKGDGAEERRRISGSRTLGGWTIYRLIKEWGYPEGRYQVLCMNCNFAKGHNNNVCPHKK